MKAEYFPVLEEHSSHSLFSSCRKNPISGQPAGRNLGRQGAAKPLLYLKVANAENRMAFQDRIPDIMSELAVNKRQDENQ